MVPNPRARQQSPQARLAALGLSADAAIDRLRRAGLWDDDGPTSGTEALLAQLADAAAPDDALHVLTELAQTSPGALEAVRSSEIALARLIALAGASRPLGELLARVPATLASLDDPYLVASDAIADEVERAVADADDPSTRAAAIAAVRRRTTAAIAARDLHGELPVERVGRDLAALAAGVLEGTLRAVHATVAGDAPAARICIIGMGKLGGDELNYVSDVDVVFVHDAPTGDEAEARDEAQRTCLGVLHLLNASTTMGRAYEVDPTLRPEGREGPLSRTVPSFVSYWTRWARTWEFQALLKARPVAGDLELGRELLDAAEPFVYPERLDAAAIAAVREMKGRVEAKPEVVRAGERQLKLGPGGLRDIEFAVQLLQLVHGRADRSLRVPGTLPALVALAHGGYVAEEDATTFAAAYRDLRTVEHRLQLADERRTHTLPDDPKRLERLARSLGLRADAEYTAREQLLTRIRASQAVVRDLHAKLFYRPLLEVHGVVPAADVEVVAAPSLDASAAARRLEAMGFADARGALRDLRELTGGVSRRATTLRAVLPAMLHALVSTPDPDGGLRSLRTIVEAHGDASELLALLRDRPPVADLLARIVGTSPVGGELLATQPQGIQWLIDEDRGTPRDRAQLVSSALGQLRWQPDLASRMGALRRLKRRELTRIVVRDLAGEVVVHDLARELTSLAEACLEAGVAAVLDDVTADAPALAQVAVIAMGKLGGQELHYPSDLDVMFVHEPAEGVGEPEAAAFAIAVAEQVLKALSAVTAEGTAFEVDAELRPEGRSGPLSRSVASCRAYYERWSQPWEHQALLKARPVAGDAAVADAFMNLATDLAYPVELPAGDVAAMRKMKARVERERVPARLDRTRHLKLGPGGLTDVEWTVQLLQHRHGHRHAALRTTSTIAAIDAAQDRELLDERDATWLREGYRFLSHVRNRLYLLRQRDVDVLPASAAVTERVGRALGYGRGGWQAFEEDHRRTTRRVRQVMERRFYGRE